MADSVLTRARYAGLDFDTHGDDLRAQLQIKFAADFNDFVISSTGIMLLDLTAFGLSTLSFYLDRRVTDLYLETARTRKSVARTTRQIGYKMGGAVASGVDLDVSITTPIAVNVTIPTGFKFKGPSNLVFEVARDVTWTPSEQLAGDVKIVRCYEGETVTEQFVSDGTANQVFELRRVPTGKYLVSGTVTCMVDGVPFTEVGLLEYGETDQFEIGFNDDPPTLRFGDGISGNIPKLAATIDVSYMSSRGRDGQVAKNTITAPLRPLVVNFQTIGLSITNTVSAVGGDAPESLSRAKSFAPKVYKSRYRAITAEDYDGLAGAYADPLFGRVAVARAISARSADNDLTLQNLLSDIDTAIAAFHPTIAAQVTAANTALGLLSGTNLPAITTNKTAVNTQLGIIDTTSDLIATGSRAVQDAAADIAVASASITASTANGNNQVDAYGPTGTTDLDASQVDAIKQYFNAIAARASQIATSGSASSSAATTISTAASAIKTAVDTAQDATALITTSVASATTNVTTTSTAVAAISAANASVESDIATATDAIFAHVSAFLNEDCAANLVVVPILTLDAAGFYSAPSVGLVDSLQNYLDARKDVTHTVSVTSGANFLVPAVITLRIGVKRGTVSEQAVKTSVAAAIDGLLRNRAFGAALYVSDIENVVRSVSGVVFSNVSIVGPVGKLDSSGNLVVLDSEVITKGSVGISTEIAPN